VVLQLHTKLKYISNLPLSYVYGALVIDAKPFGLLAQDDQAVVREVMEGIYRKIDEESVRTDEQAFNALIEKGLVLVEPSPEEIPAWRERVAESNRELASRGVIPAALLNELLAHLEEHRSGRPE
jgi:TRAP-type C4-dicarboxylate transport system substrate-binding protein